MAPKIPALVKDRKLKTGSNGPVPRAVKPNYKEKNVIAKRKMEEEHENWNIEGRAKDVHQSPSCSSFEVLDPHDPTISRLATQLFKRTNDYLHGEMTATQDHYTLLEDINRMAITKYTDLRNLAVNLSKTLNEYNELYHILIKPLLMQIDHIDTQVSQFEANAYRLDSYTKQLRARYKKLEEK